MSVFRSSRWQASLAVVALLFIWTASAQGLVIILDEQFADDPIAAGRAVVDGDGSRFSYAGNTLTAGYDSALPTSKLNWSLGQTLTQNDPVRFTVEFSIRSTGFQAIDDTFMQIAFGLSNSLTTGTSRTGDAGDFASDTFDMMTFDYFPQVSPTFGFDETLTPTLFGSEVGGDGFNNFNSVFGSESELDAEGPLPLDTTMTAIIDYDPFVNEIVLTMPGQLINAGGGADGLTETIQLNTTATPFAFDTFSLLLFVDGFGGGNSTVLADVDFTRITVETAIPEPASAALLGLAGLALLRRRRR